MPVEYSQEILNRFIPEIDHTPGAGHPEYKDEFTRYGGSMILSGVINDNGDVFDFFNKSHHVDNSGQSFIYDLIEISGMSGVDWDTDYITWSTIYGSRVEEYAEVDDNTTYFLNSNQIIDLSTVDPYGIFSAASDIGTHIDNNDDNCFYCTNSDEIINAMDHGRMFRFCILLHMYYYDYFMPHPDWWDAYSPYFGDTLEPELMPDRRGDRCDRLWYQAVNNSVTNGSRQWDPDSAYIDQGGTSYHYITDYPEGYSQGHVLYHPYQTYKVPGLVFECFKQCPSSSYYTIRSLNEFDDHNEYMVSGEDMDLILRGIHYGMRHFVDACVYNFGNPTITNLFSYLVDLDYPNNPAYPGAHWFRTQKCIRNIQGDPLSNRYVAFDIQYDSQDTDANMTKYYLENISTVEIDNVTYPTGSLDANGDPIEAYNFPVFVTSLGDRSFDDVVFVDDLSGSDELEIIKHWADDSCRGVRPPFIDIDLYILEDGVEKYLETLTMTEEEDRVNETTWRHVFPVYKYKNGNSISYVIWEHYIHAHDNNNVWIGPDPGVYTITYDYPYTHGNFSGGSAIYRTKNGYPGYYAEITNTVNYNAVLDLGDVRMDIHITKVWDGFERCDSNEACHCRAETTGIININGTNYDWQSAHHPIDHTVISNVPLINIRGNNFIEEKSGDWYMTASHSDNYLEWTVVNVCNEINRYPIDDSEIGNIFYFETDPECINLAGDLNVRGFGVSGNWRGSMGRPLVYKICYFPVDFDGFKPGTQEYYDWLYKEWTPYYEGNNILDSNGYITAGSEYNDIPPLKYSGEDIIVPYNTNLAKNNIKVRIYIGAERVHRDRLGTFVLSTYRDTGGQTYDKYADNTEYPYNASLGIPIRCGGYINSLYGLSVSGEKELYNDVNDITDGDIRLGIWDNWVETQWHIANIRVNGTEKYSKQYVFSNKKASDNNTARVDDWIHSRRLFRLSGLDYGEGYVNGEPERWALGGIQNSEVKVWYNSNVPYNNDGGVVKGGMYARLFEGNHNLVDASQLIIPLPYCDLMYFKTFADTGLLSGNTIQTAYISSKIAAQHHHPQWAIAAGETEKLPCHVFGALKGMYSDCKRISVLYNVAFHSDHILKGGLVIGMHYFDSMFSGVTGLGKTEDWDINYEQYTTSLGEYFPWGACMNMFARTYGCNYNIVNTSGNTQETNPNPFGDTVICQVVTDGHWFGPRMIRNAQTVGGHAFRGMFQNSSACYYTMRHRESYGGNCINVDEGHIIPNQNTIPAFACANMFNSNNADMPKGSSSDVNLLYGFDYITYACPQELNNDPGIIGKGAFWGTFKNSKIRTCMVGLSVGVGGDNSYYNKWSFGYMFDGCSYLGHIYANFKNWLSHGIAHKNWVRGVTKDKRCIFMRDYDYTPWSPITQPRCDNRIPKKWSVCPGVGEARVECNGWDFDWNNPSILPQQWLHEGWQHGYVL